MILISAKTEFKPRIVTRDKEVIIKGSIQEEDKTILNIFKPNTAAPKYIKQYYQISRENRQ